MPYNHQILPVTIANGTSQASMVNLHGRRLAAIYMPSAWTAAAITFLAATTPDATALSVVDDGGTEISLTVAVDQFVVLTGTDAEALKACQNLVVRSGTNATPVNQGADRTLYLVLLPE